MKTYSQHLVQELKSASANDTFRMNSLHTRISASMNLNPEDSEPFPGALPVNVHEYVHNLHNLTTSTGLTILFNELNLMFEFIRGASSGRYKAPPGTNPTIRSILKLYKELIGTVKIDFPGEIKRGTFHFGRIYETEKTTKIIDTKMTYKHYAIKLEEANTKGKTKKRRTLAIGYNFITEGIAYEVDRSIRLGTGSATAQSADEHTPYFPYLMYKDLIDHLIGRESTSDERIIIGLCGLQLVNPGFGFIYACKTLKQTKDKDTSAVLRELAKNNAETNFEYASSLLKNTIPEWKLRFQGSSLEQAFDYYAKVLEYTCNSRNTFPLVELLMRSIREPSDLLDLIATMAPTWIIQELPEGDAEISFIGNEAVSDQGSDTHMAVLQCAFHYIQHHIRTNGNLYKTEEVFGVRCPYIGACVARRSTLDPTQCEDKPWEAKQENGERAVCYYTAAVGSLELVSMNSHVANIPSPNLDDAAARTDNRIKVRNSKVDKKRNRRGRFS